MACSAFECFGMAAAAYVALCVLLFVKRTYFTGSSDSLKRVLSKGGNWAVVTGASDGIGRALSIELGRRGFDVVLLARTVSKLESVAAEIKAKRPEAQTLVLPFDFATAGDKEYAILFAELDTKNIGVLCNNVGINYEFPQGFDAAPIADDLAMLKVNCESQLRMTKYVLPKMKGRRAGAILGLGSFTSAFPTPFLAAYSGTKAFAAGFFDALAVELQGSGIHVLTVTPNLVISRMTAGEKAATAKPSFLRVAAHAMARATLDKVGAVSRTAGHANHELVEAIAGLLPRAFFNSYLLKTQKAVNKKALKSKAAKDEAAAKKQ